MNVGRQKFPDFVTEIKPAWWKCGETGDHALSCPEKKAPEVFPNVI